MGSHHCPTERERDEGGRDRDGGRKEKRERKGEKRRIGEGGRDALGESDIIFTCYLSVFTTTYKTSDHHCHANVVGLILREV